MTKKLYEMRVWARTQQSAKKFVPKTEVITSIKTLENTHKKPGLKLHVIRSKKKK